jgi:hypothetical protein
VTGFRLQVARYASLLCGLLLVACTTPPTTAKPCSKDADCSAGDVCTNGKCSTPKKNCTPGQTSCDGSKVVSCSADGQTQTVVTVCGTSCQAGACASVMCTPGDQRCDGNTNLVRCSADGTRFDPVSVCDLGCDSTTSMCKAGICKPGSTRCTADGALETCDTRGAGWTSAKCDTGGLGKCTTNGLLGASMVAFCEKLSCTPGDIRCDGLEVVQCDAGGGGESLVTTCEHACTKGACVDGACKPGDQQCSVDGKSLERCNDLGTGYNTQSCVTDGTGVCIAVPGIAGPQAARCARTLCTAGAIRCDSDKRFQCAMDGLSETVIETCNFGCGLKAACADPACAPGAQRCNGDTLEQCQPDRRGYVFNQFCAAGCVDATASQQAHCGNQICSPLDARCAADGVSLQRCRADGTGYDTTACDAGQVCKQGACVAPAPACVPDALRCNGHDVEKCESVNGQPLSYTKIGACLGNCSGTSCDNAGECSPFNLSIPLAAPGANLPGDGQSTFLILSDPLVGPDGTAVPDGTFVTVAADGGGGPAPALLSADADPSTPGLQIRVVDGRIDFLIRAPSIPLGTEAATIKAQIGDRFVCAAKLGVTFDASVTDRYAGEDFSTTRVRDLQVSSTANWDTTRGVLTINAFDAGDGRDGDLVVGPGQTVDLSTRTAAGHSFADMASAPVQEINNAQLTVNGSLAAFQQPGTRVLLVNLQGAPSQSTSVGAYEFATVQGTDNGVLTLTHPVARRYGVGGNSAAALSGQVVRVIRVPQYNSVQVAGTLTGPAFDGTQGGVLAFFAASTLPGKTSGGQVVPGSNLIYGTGSISMHGMGFRGASLPTSNASGLSGEGVEASLNTPSPVGGTGVSGGGYCCGDGDIVPASMPANGPGVVAPGTPAPPDVVTHKYFGSGGSFASQGASSCPSFGPGSTYGDSNLQDVFMGGGSGSVSQSTAHTCNNVKSCCRRVDAANYGLCCENPSPHVPADAAGASCVTTPYCDVSVDPTTKLMVDGLWSGVYAGQAGGGIILITVGTLTVTDNGSIDAGGVNATIGNYGSAGGSIFVSGQTLSLGGVGHVTALGGAGGGDGRIRIDAVSVDTGFVPAWTTPAAAYTQAPPNLVQSIVELTLSTMPTGYAQSSGVMFPAGMSIPVVNGAPDNIASSSATNLQLWLTEDGGQNWGPVSADQGALSFGGAGQPPVGSSMKWRLTAPTTTGSTRGLASKFTRN